VLLNTTQKMAAGLFIGWKICRRFAQ